MAHQPGYGWLGFGYWWSQGCCVRRRRESAVMACACTCSWTVSNSHVTVARRSHGTIVGILVMKLGVPWMDRRALIPCNPHGRGAGHWSGAATAVVAGSSATE